MGKTKTVETVEEVTPTPIQHKNTTTGKTVRTFYQACAGVLAVVLPILTFLATNDEFRNAIMDTKYAWILGVLPALIPVTTALFTYLQNYVDPTVPNNVNDTEKI